MTDNFDIIKDFLTPKEIFVEEVNPNHSKIILEPLERGFGHTLGTVSYTHLTLPTIYSV